jgi:hypothetical protein
MSVKLVFIILKKAHTDIMSLFALFIKWVVLESNQ